MSNPRHPARGFTVIELIVTVSIVGILAAVAAPSFTGMIATSRVKGVASNLHMSLLKARSEAIKRNASVTVSRNPSSWGEGWRVLDAGGNVLSTEGKPVGATTTATTADSTIIYLRSGRLQDTTPPSFTVAPSSTSLLIKNSYQCRRVSVGTSGVASVTKVACP